MPVSGGVVPGPPGGVPGGSGVGGGVVGGGVFTAGQKLLNVAELADHCPAAVKSLGPRLFVVEWQAEQEPTSGTVGSGAQNEAT